MLTRGRGPGAPTHPVPGRPSRFCLWSAPVLVRLLTGRLRLADLRSTSPLARAFRSASPLARAFRSASPLARAFRSASPLARAPWHPALFAAVRRLRRSPQRLPGGPSPNVASLCLFAQREDAGRAGCEVCRCGWGSEAAGHAPRQTSAPGTPYNRRSSWLTGPFHDHGGCPPAGGRKSSVIMVFHKARGDAGDDLAR